MLLPYCRKVHHPQPWYERPFIVWPRLNFQSFFSCDTPTPFSQREWLVAPHTLTALPITVPSLCLCLLPETVFSQNPSSDLPGCLRKVDPSSQFSKKATEAFYLCLSCRVGLVLKSSLPCNYHPVEKVLDLFIIKRCVPILALPSTLYVLKPIFQFPFTFVWSGEDLYQLS